MPDQEGGRRSAIGQEGWRLVKRGGDWSRGAAIGDRRSAIGEVVLFVSDFQFGVESTRPARILSKKILTDFLGDDDQFGLDNETNPTDGLGLPIDFGPDKKY